MTCKCLSVPIAWEKLEGPTSVLTFLGVEVDALAMQLRLPLTTLSELRDLIQGRLKVSEISLDH